MTVASIVNELFEQVRLAKPASLKQLASLREYLEASQPHFVSVVFDKSKCLTYQEEHVCLLIREGFAPSDVANLLGLSKQRITDLRATINQKLFNEHGTRFLDERLKQL